MAHKRPFYSSMKENEIQHDEAVEADEIIEMLEDAAEALKSGKAWGLWITLGMQEHGVTTMHVAVNVSAATELIKAVQDAAEQVGAAQRASADPSSVN